MGRDYYHVTRAYWYYHAQRYSSKLHGVCELGWQDQEKNDVCYEDLAQTSSIVTLALYFQQVSYH